MTKDDIIRHIVDFGKGILGAMIAAALMAGLQFIGAHIPVALNLLAQISGGIVGVKTGNGQ